ISLPGLDPVKLTMQQSSQGLMGLLDMFAGGSFSRASIFALGIMPYISASIAMQLLTIVVPSYQKLQKEGESGQRKITQHTRYLTVLVTGAQAIAYVSYLKSQSAQAILPEFQGITFWLTTVIVLTSGSLFVMWLGEKITDKGIGNGTSLLIEIGIIASLPGALVYDWQSKANMGGGGLLIFLLEIAFLIAVIAGLVALVQGTRKIPVNYAKRGIGAKQVGGARQFLPLKVNAAGVMPIIFAQSIMFIPMAFASLATPGGTMAGIIQALSDFTSVPYNIVYALMVILFTYFYTALIFNPTQMADQMKRNNGFIPGIKPGKATANYIGTIMDRIMLPGSIFLAIVGVLPAFASAININQQFAIVVSGTSMLIIVAVVVHTLEQIAS